MNLSWKINEDYLLAKTNNFKFNKHIAMFDLDNTLIATKSNKRFPLNENDWKFKYDNIKKILNILVDNNYSIIIITNQGGIENGKQNRQEWQTKVNNIIKSLNIDIMLFCSTGINRFRKPQPTFYTEYIKVIEPNPYMIFYCGDALGRLDDHSDSDLKFALNCKIDIISPETLFLNKSIIIPDVKYPDLIFKLFDFTFEPARKRKEIIIMYGYPASGKSCISYYITKNYNYVVINQDTLKTKSKCKKVCIEYMQKNKNIIIDATNKDIAIRKEWIDIALKHDYYITSIIVDTSKDVSKHNNHYRHYNFNIKLVPNVVYNLNYEEPTTSEKIDRIITTTNFTPIDLNYFMFFY